MKKIVCLVLCLLMLLSCVSLLSADEVAESEKYIYRTNTYDFAVTDKDPMFMTDEDFFGTYDRYGNEVTPSKLKYEEFPELAAVEAAAKEEDYDTSKEALYE